MANILAVDDDRDLCTLLKTALERDGHTVETRCTGADVTSSLCRWADCILLDVMMPGEDGFAVCRRIRAQTEAPILFLTARTDEPSVLTGLGIGADDYLVKPFRLAELRARVNAHLRRQNRAPQHRLVRGGVCFDRAARSCRSPSPSMPSASFLPCTPGRHLAKSRSTRLCSATMARPMTPPLPSTSKTSAPSCAPPGWPARKPC